MVAKKKSKKVASKVVAKPAVKVAKVDAKESCGCGCSCINCKCGKKVLMVVATVIVLAIVAKVILYKDCPMRHFRKRPCAEKCMKGENCRPCMDRKSMHMAPPANMVK